MDYQAVRVKVYERHAKSRTRMYENVAQSHGENPCPAATGPKANAKLEQATKELIYHNLIRPLTCRIYDRSIVLFRMHTSLRN